jgi:hypothetical protein
LKGLSLASPRCSERPGLTGAVGVGAECSVAADDWAADGAGGGGCAFSVAIETESAGAGAGGGSIAAGFGRAEVGSAFMAVGASAPFDDAAAAGEPLERSARAPPPTIASPSRAKPPTTRARLEVGAGGGVCIDTPTPLVAIATDRAGTIEGGGNDEICVWVRNEIWP